MELPPGESAASFTVAVVANSLAYSEKALDTAAA
jgi:hypothetical protein